MKVKYKQSIVINRLFCRFIHTTLHMYSRGILLSQNSWQECFAFGAQTNFNTCRFVRGLFRSTHNTEVVVRWPMMQDSADSQTFKSKVHHDLTLFDNSFAEKLTTLWTVRVCTGYRIWPEFSCEEKNVHQSPAAQCMQSSPLSSFPPQKAVPRAPHIVA